MNETEQVKDITPTVWRILGCVLLGLVALFCLGWFTGCSGDNGTSVPSRICYDKELGYSDVANNGDYTEYASEWLEVACTGGWIGNDCVSYDNHATIVKHVCLENVDDDPSTEPRPRTKEKVCAVYYYFKSHSDGTMQIYIDEGGKESTDDVVSRFTNAHIDLDINKIDEVCHY